MSKPDYLEWIDTVATDLKAATYEEKLLDTWARFERTCAELRPEYDILSDEIPGTNFLHDAADFVKLLYENDDATATAQMDCDQIREKDAAYGGSWHSRGGTGAFHALARKGDRLVSMLRTHRTLGHCRHEKHLSESIDDTIGDLRRYLILVLAWHRAKRGEPKPLIYSDVDLVKCRCGHERHYHHKKRCEFPDAQCDCSGFDLKILQPNKPASFA